MVKQIHLDYDYSVFLEANYDVESSCVKHQVYELTDIHNNYGGFPKSYCLENTKIYQLWWDNTQIDFKLLGDLLGIEVITVSSIKQPPGNVVPIHRDTFFQINQRFPDRKETKVRANIYMEDWQVGHMIQYQKHEGWANSTHWRAGDGFIWDSEPLHVSMNAGFKDKYTMQISGFLHGRS